MAQEGNFVVAQASKLMIYAGKSDEVKASDTEPTDEQLEEVADEQQ